MNCTHPVPDNPFGIFAMHCRDNAPMTQMELAGFINGPVRLAQDRLNEDLMNEFRLGIMIIPEFE